jgi:hypothetical protein
MFIVMLSSIWVGSKHLLLFSRSFGPSIPQIAGLRAGRMTIIKVLFSCQRTSQSAKPILLPQLGLLDLVPVQSKGKKLQCPKLFARKVIGAVKPDFLLHYVEVDGGGQQLVLVSGRATFGCDLYRLL